MKESIIDKILCSTGYLPPRNEEEMDAFEKEYSKVTIDKSFRVDVDSIINGSCHLRPQMKPMASSGQFSQTNLRMAARNFENLPEEVVEKMMSQHKKNGDKG